jgi:type IV pilus assembly protein PilP
MNLPMKTNDYTTIMRRLLLVLGACCIAASWPLSIQAMPETKDNTGGEITASEPSTNNGTPATSFVYQLEGRLDPFMPFLSEKAANPNNMDEIVENNETLSGMQLFEPAQLKLVAIVFADDSEIAMVEDAAGQGYAIRSGMKIGRKGMITSITSNQVVIEESSVTRAGKQLTNNIVMQLKKEGEE